MKRLVTALCVVVATTSLGWAEDAPNYWTATFASEVRFFSWRSDRGYPTSVSASNFRGHGSQLYIPFAAQLVGRPSEDLKIEIFGRGGWVWARQSTSAQTGEVATMTDTVASTTVSYLGLNGIQPFFSLGLNIPTGRSALFGAAPNARMDPDLVDIANFGEGFNVGPTIGASLPISSTLVVTVSAGYTRRGEFVREKSIIPIDPTVQASTKIKPGDVITGTVSLAHQMGQFSSTITGSISEDTATAVDGMEIYRPGRRYLISGAWSYTWPEFGVTSWSASWAHANRNDVLFAGATALALEPFNTNSNLYRVGAQHLFPMGQWWLGPIGSFLLRDRNGYDSTTLQFVPAKRRWSAGGIVQVVANEKLTFNARAEHVWTFEDENPNDVKWSVLANAFIPGSALPQISSTGWQFALGANARF